MVLMIAASMACLSMAIIPEMSDNGVLASVR